jgi:hypothetical protein
MVVGVAEAALESSVMTHPDHPALVHLSHCHCGAVCKEIGERLSLALGPQSSELSPALLALIEQLAKRKTTTAIKDFTGLNE